MKCLKGKRLKWIIVLAGLFLIVRNITLTGKLALKKTYGITDFFDFNQNTSVAIQSSNIVNQKGSAFHPLKKSSDGYNLANRLYKKCTEVKTFKEKVKVFGSYEWHSIETCIIWKIGTTMLKRLYMIKNLPQFGNITNPYEIRFDRRYLPKSAISSSGQSGTRFMFVRDPYRRLVSGFVDKLLAPNPFYWEVIGIPAIKVTRQNPGTLSLKCGHDLKFHEYIKYVIEAFNPKVRGAKPDGHFDRMVTLCKPCSIRYDFVGKMESFAQDSLELLRRLNFSDQSVKLMETEGGKLAWMDALKDTAHQPFDITFRKKYINCISFYSALKRSWKKMQVRGIIGRQDFPLKESEANALTEAKFIQLAITAREHSTSEERKMIQEEYFLELFSTVPKDDLQSIRKLYASDFELFEYDDRPSNLFRNDI